MDEPGQKRLMPSKKILAGFIRKIDPYLLPDYGRDKRSL
jgi:hypothetical protein